MPVKSHYGSAVLDAVEIPAMELPLDETDPLPELSNGTDKLTVSLAGFTTVNRDVVVNVGSNVNLGFALKVATVEEAVTVTAETPIVGTKNIGTATTLTKEELAQIPSARDPWAMLRTVPGVIMDRVNIGGNENGQQAAARRGAGAKGGRIAAGRWRNPRSSSWTTTRASGTTSRCCFRPTGTRPWPRPRPPRPSLA